MEQRRTSKKHQDIHLYLLSIPFKEKTSPNDFQPSGDYGLGIPWDSMLEIWGEFIHELCKQKGIWKLWDTIWQVCGLFIYIYINIPYIYIYQYTIYIYISIYHIYIYQYTIYIYISIYHIYISYIIYNMMYSAALQKAKQFCLGSVHESWSLKMSIAPLKIHNPSMKLTAGRLEIISLFWPETPLFSVQIFQHRLYNRLYLKGRCFKIEKPWNKLHQACLNCYSLQK